jgi:dimethylaniline monooxygenase (N-oxide forming)
MKWPSSAIDAAVLIRDARVEPFKGKNVVIVGLSSSASELTSLLLPHVKSLRLSHRRGAYMIPIWRNNTPADLQATHRRREMGRWLGQYFPRLARWAFDAGLKWYIRKSWGELDPQWRILPAPSPAVSLPGASDVIIPLLREGRVKSVQGIKRFIGPSTLELTDGSIFDDIDAVICATGYSSDMSVASSFLTRRWPAGYDGPPLANLYMNIFPPAYADSMAILCYCSYCKTNGFSFNDVMSLAVSNVFRGAHSLPPAPDMTKEIHRHHDWLASVYREDTTQGSFDPNMVQGWRFNSQLHKVAGTGMEALGWGLKGWMFWWKDPKMYKLMNTGLETAHAYRFFETGKRKAWIGAREAIIRVNEEARCFPLSDEEKARYVAMRGPA